MSAKYYAMELINRGFVVDLESVGTRNGWEQGNWICVEAWKDRDGNSERWWRRYIEYVQGANDGVTYDGAYYNEMILESRGDGTYLDMYETYRRAKA